MNRNYIKALLLTGVIGSSAVVANAQGNYVQNPPVWAFPGGPYIPLWNTYLLTGAVPGQGMDWVTYCWNPLTTKDPWSTTYGIEYEYDSMMGAVGGVSGTVTYDGCLGQTSTTLDMQGRLGFFVGGDPYQTLPNGAANPHYGQGGSVQDNIQAALTGGTVVDDGMGLTYGTYSGVAGNFSIANFVQSTASTTAGGAPTTKMEFFGKNAILDAWVGASNRYFIETSTASFGGSEMLEVNIIGDAARCQWKVQNTGTATNTSIGLDFGQWVNSFAPGENGPSSFNYITAPGLEPLQVLTRFLQTPQDNAAMPTANTNMTPLTLPPYIDFGLSQSNAYGLQVVLGPSAQIPDQTQAVGLDVAYNGWILGSMTADDGAMPDGLEPDLSLTDSYGSDAYIEVLPVQPVGAYTGNSPGGADTAIFIAYFRSTWGVSDYNLPYSVVLDAPQVIATTPGNPYSFQYTTPATIAVHVDNTGHPYGQGFSTIGEQIPLEDVAVTLTLPPGMTEWVNGGPSNISTITEYIQEVPAQVNSLVYFQVAVDPTLVGTVQYTVTVTPQPGPVKTLTGSIVVASQPYLTIGSSANLVTAPWTFGSPDWATIIGANTNLVLDQDFQVFGWDALQQQYILQTDALRGAGSFIISDQAVGTIPLGGSPQQDSDVFTGAPAIILQPGWNLIANPYNFAIPLGELVGVAEANNDNAYTFSQLVNLNYVNGFLAFWSTLTNDYQYTQTLDDLMQPNTGYWIYVTSDQAVTISWPQVFQAFVPGLQYVDEGWSWAKQRGTPLKSKARVPLGTPEWALQLAARTNTMLDATTTIGQAKTSNLVTTLTKHKAPVAPMKHAVSSYIYVTNNSKVLNLAQALTTDNVKEQVWTWNIFTQSAGPVTLTWPNIGSVPNNVTIRLTDASTGASELLRNTSKVTFEGAAQGTKTYKLEVLTGAPEAVIESVTAAAASGGAKVSYDLSVNATTTVTISNSTGGVIATLALNQSESSGVSKVAWNYLDAANRPVPNGTYKAVVSATPSGGQTETKSVSITVKR